ncbi:uncharacterized protein LOC114325698 [Diabrotica virgifera virgifera]|uniref:Uncharacterized protein LOC114325698 n=1 Tax=Diabrotica virgifera virgifera TaxID=50390 RepID=A0A6P7F848_DIAVI|nr:uncharacterized protein LOC114325698 [Diabrotica virgifera virgifera]
MDKIRNFEELISDYIGPFKTVVDTKSSNLTAPGENYLSDIIKIDIVLKDKITNKNEDLSLVAKLTINHEFMGPTHNITKNEVIFYRDVIPAIKRFHRKHGLPSPSFYPDFAGGRINLTGDEDKADEDAVLVLENLVTKGYKNQDRHVGCDLATSMLILKDLATFHAVPLAMRLLEPEEFSTLTKKISIAMPPTKKKDNKPPTIFKIMIDTLNANDKHKTAADKLKKMLADFSKAMEEDPEKMFNNDTIRTFSTIVHQDVWINNTMQVMENDVAIKNKFVDFQMCQLGMPADDLIFFLFSSVEFTCLKDNLDSLIKHYYESFISILKQLNLYTEDFSYEKFLEEFKTPGKLAIVRTLFMLPNVIFGEKGKAAEHEKMKEMTVEDIHPIALKKMLLLCVESAQRDWF